MADVAASHAVVERTPRLIRQDDPELYKFGLQVSGHCVIEQDERQARLVPGDLAIYDTSRPYRISFSGQLPDDRGDVISSISGHQVDDRVAEVGGDNASGRRDIRAQPAREGGEQSREAVIARQPHSGDRGDVRRRHVLGGRITGIVALTDLARLASLYLRNPSE